VVADEYLAFDDLPAPTKRERVGDVAEGQGICAYIARSEINVVLPDSFPPSILLQWHNIPVGAKQNAEKKAYMSSPGSIVNDTPSNLHETTSPTSHSEDSRCYFQGKGKCVELEPGNERRRTGTLHASHLLARRVDASLPYVSSEVLLAHRRSQFHDLTSINCFDAVERVSDFFAVPLEVRDLIAERPTCHVESPDVRVRDNGAGPRAVRRM
jgi:hypothetical protein